MASPRKAAADLPLCKAWWIADGRFDPFSAIGASLVGGRWNSPGRGVICASQLVAAAMLECLAHAGIGRVPKRHVVVEIDISAAVSTERHDESSLPAGWDQRDLRVVARAFGDKWLEARRSAVLVLPSVVARKENNVLLNPQHPHFASIVSGQPEPVIWDARLLGKH